MKNIKFALKIKKKTCLYMSIKHARCQKETEWLYHIIFKSFWTMKQIKGNWCVNWIAVYVFGILVDLQASNKPRSILRNLLRPIDPLFTRAAPCFKHPVNLYNSPSCLLLVRMKSINCFCNNCRALRETTERVQTNTDFIYF